MLDDSHVAAIARPLHQLMLLMAPAFDPEALLKTISDMIEAKQNSDGSGVELGPVMAQVTELAVAVEQART